MQNILPHATADLVFLDESGARLNRVPASARAPKGQRAYCAQPGHRGQLQTMIGAVSLQGVQAMMTLEGALDTQAFLAYLQKVLLPTLHKGQVLVMDNLSVHKAQAIQTLLKKAGVPWIYLPPYSPELSPIELFWSKLKQFLKKKKAKTQKALFQALRQGLQTISNQDCRNWFAHCGYWSPIIPKTL